MRSLVLIILTLCSSLANAGEFVIDEASCTDLAFVSTEIVEQYEAKKTREEVVSGLLDPTKLKKLSYRATAPLLFNITYDLYSGVLKVGPKEVWDSVYSMCKQRIGTKISYQGK